MNPKRNRRRGKANQKAIAELFNGKDVGVLGESDVITEKFCIEAKSRKKFVGEKWYRQAEEYTKKDPLAKGKIPIVVVHITGKRHENDFVIIRVKDFLELLKS
ncbi:MAG: hypothetical protein DRH57_00020 [Candidatus Cloacimonadota bacterium]|nr:MAG: hypothetical protein DRH57_00020 [Candidatus Cloacimonadota bacterium]